MRDDPMSVAGRGLNSDARRKGATMMRGQSLGALLLALGVLLGAPGKAQPQPAPRASKPAKPSSKAAAHPVEPALEPKAIDLLKASSSRLAAAHSMTFATVISYESPSRLGPPLIYTTRSEVTLQRPDKLRVITPGDGPASEFYYDGKTMTAFAPGENLIAVAPAPATIDAALEAAYHSAAIYFPFTDAIVADPYKAIAESLELAFYIGQARVVGGTTTDIVAYAAHGVFVQIWIGAQDKLPRRARAVFANDPLRLRHQVDFANWQLDRAVAPDTFAPARAAKARPIPFAHPDPGPATSAAPPANSASPKTQ